MNMTLSRGANVMQDVALLIGRILVAILFLVAAYNKFVTFPNIVTYFGRLGLPLPNVMLIVVLIFEVAAGVAMIAGFKTRWAALAIGLFCLVAALIAHTNIADGNQFNHLLKNLAIFGGCLSFFVSGGGRYSLDKR